MVDLNKLKGRLTEKNISKATLAGVLGITYDSVCSKLRGSSRITLEEANSIKEYAGFSAEEATAIFFASTVA